MSLHSLWESSGARSVSAGLCRAAVAGLLRMVALIALVLTCLPAPVYAQGAPELEKRTQDFAIVYSPGSESEANRYAGFVDGIYDEMAAIFHTRVQAPVTLRLYGTLAEYYKVNPLAEQITGVIAHSAVTKREISVALPRTANLDTAAVINNVRHELTHVIIGDMSGNRLPTGFHEGIAQYTEKPGPETQASVSLLRQGQASNRLLTWQDFNERDKVYSDPRVAYPESLAVVSFLVDRYGFPKLLELIASFKTSNGYRGALETTYGVGADELEAGWRDWLPSYLAGRWKLNALYSFDLSRAEEMVKQGAYSAAQNELNNAIELLRSTQQSDTLAKAQDLLTRAQRGEEAGVVANRARTAVEQNDYAQALRQARTALTIYAELGNAQRDNELHTYEARATQGLSAQEQLTEAARQIGQLRFDTGGDLARQAGLALKALGDESGVARSAALLANIETRKQQAAYGLVGLAGLAFLINLLRRLWSRRQPQPSWENLV